jgi:predicted membrane GTPase involved in stress response
MRLRQGGNGGGDMEYTHSERGHGELVMDYSCSPEGSTQAPLKMLLYDSMYDQYRGVICIMAITDGMLTKGM